MAELRITAAGEQGGTPVCDVFGARTRVLVSGNSGPHLVGAAARGGGLGLLASADLLGVAGTIRGLFGVRVSPGCGLSGDALVASGATLVLVDPGAEFPTTSVPVVAGVRSLPEAAAALEAGAAGLLVAEDGEQSNFVLLQQLLDTYGPGTPIWVAGTGPRTAAGVVAAGAFGVLLDEQLALLPEARTPAERRGRLSRSDTSLAPLFARRYPDAERAVRDVVAAVRERPVTGPAEQGEPLRRTLGSALPIVQGPMTRVSDQPEFAAAVAEHGGFPFVAVATATGPSTADLLRRTADLLGDRPWGAGLLGFLDADLVARQLAEVTAARPRCALLAGGRVAQAKALEAAGIATYLHAPSPILLRQFLDAGLRRFVFEGAECGGHVGPRSSFVLWEQQLDVLRGAGPGVEILFAGGVHDARSAALVAAMAAEQAAAGTGVGVLMGTAYLFTREAVESGAITDVFQDLLVRAASTVTLETAPGHRTRCLPSPYTDRFEAVRTELSATSGMPAQEVWQRLEDLNTGRLRIASKGLRRTDAGPAEVDATAQVSDGLYLAGQVTALRTGTTTMAELHDQVTTGAANVLRARAERPRTSSDGRDIAIIGIACSFPGAADLPAFWSNILRGVDAVTEVPADRWDADRYADASASHWGGFLPPLAFDPLSYGIPPASMGAIDPAQLVSLETARRALADAGYADREFDREHTSVIFGAEAGGDLANAAAFRALLPTYLEQVPTELLAELPALTEDTFPGTLANVISGRIANRLDLRGANYTVDAACGSSLAALDVAVKELRQGTSAIVLCGAVDLHNGINDYLMFTSAGALSPTGKCRPFDAAADGIALGEGVACLVLKRLADAEQDGDRVYAVVKGVGAASDGRALGLTAPHPEGQHRALTRAYADARVSPSEVTMVEAHGTGTVVGDATELRTLTEFFTAAGARPGTIALGSVKSQIGHTKCAAGLAGLIKAALALWHEVMPPTLNLAEPNSAWQATVSPFAFATVARPAPGRRGLAGVSAFGFGGTNFHAVLAAGPVQPGREHGLRDWSGELVLARGTDLAAARAGLAALAESAPGRPLRELALAAASGGAGDPVQLAVVAESAPDLTDPARGITVSGDRQAGKVAFLFPGQGSQRAGMLAELFVHFPELADVLRLAPDLVPVVFPPTAFDDAATDAQERAVTDTSVAQPALGLAEAALCALLGELGVTPDFLAGHSFGELVALHAAGAFDLPTLLSLSRARAAAIAGAARDRPGAMAAVRASRAEIAAELSDLDVVLANDNGPKQVVVAGPPESVGQLVARLRARGVAAKLIPVACAFHSPLVAPASDVFAAHLGAALISDPVAPVWSNRTGRRYATGSVRRELAAQIAAPVRFADQIEDMYESGARIFVEIGPGRVLTRLTEDILGARPHTAVSIEPGIRGLLTALGHLAVSGVPVDLERLFRGRVELTDPPTSSWTVDGRAVRAPDGTTPANALAPARQITRIAMTESVPAGRDQVVAEFLRNSREFIAMQREVMLGYLGSPVPAAPAPRIIEPAPSVAELPAPVRKDEPQPPADDAVDVLGTVLAVISDRTGFPPDMIENGLDLEADLSIDSIKRTEIAGTLLSRLGLVGTAGDDAADLLVRERTVTGLAKRLRDWLAPAPTEQRLGLTPRRYRQRLTTAAFGATDPDRVRGKTIAVLAGPNQDAVRDAIEARFSDAGATAVRDADADVVISLDALADADDFSAPRVFEQLKAARGTFVAVAPADVERRAGLAGLLRTAALERTAVTRLVVASSMTDIDKTLLDEVLSGDGPPVVHHLDSGRWTTTLVEEELGSIASAGAGPGTGELDALGLGPDSVVLFFGGAHGVAARAAIALAASRCRIELTGRTPWPMAGADESLPDDPRAMRRALVAAGYPAREVEPRVRTVRAQREIGRTLDQIAAAGGDAAYHPLDCRDGAAVRRLVTDLHTRHGRLDGVVHAAGVIADRLMTEKDVDSFRNVFDTKVSAATALLTGLAAADIRPGFVAFFGSISALLGNRGQTDYAAANDALDLIGEQWHSTTGGRALTVHWGPWAPAAEHGGMVSPELAREYERRNVSMIDPDEATTALLRELAYGAPDVTSVLYTASLW
jgi:acyl transferase domain-containing protein/NAD(P)H-dependent flavin oxidoreductase YrpB (nitropropane dioxygenase family)/NADP-dependent 3-hydroxy acid dehydrogenase YdfG